MVGQHSGELLDVFGLQEVFDRTCRQSGKGCVGGGEHSEWTLAFERVDQTSSLYSGDKSLEVASGNCGIDDISGVATAVVIGEGEWSGNYQ
jgi:hypothetical protein